MSYQATQPQMQGQQHSVGHSSSVSRKQVGHAAPGTYQQGAASPALSHSSIGSAWSPQSIGSSQSSPAQNVAIPSSMAQPTAHYVPVSNYLPCSLCNSDVSNDSNHLECLTCTSAGQTTRFCTPCCVTKGALGTHHHHMSNFVSASDTLVQDQALVAHGWDARKSGIGVTWYQHRATKIKTFERPNVPAPMMQASSAHLHTHSHIPVHAKTPAQSSHMIKSHQPARSVSSNHPGQFGQPTQFMPSTQPMQPVQYVQQPQHIQPAQPMQPVQYVQPVQPVPQAQTISSQQPRQQAPSTQGISTRQQIKLLQQKISQPNPHAQPQTAMPQNGQAVASQPIQAGPITETDLPPGWEEIKDPDGKVFYYYRATKLSMWTAPVNPLPQGWQMFKNPDGRTYYSNPSLALMQWNRPTAAALVGNVNRMSAGSGQASFADTISGSPKNSIHRTSPAQEYSPTFTRDGQNGQQNNSRRSSTLSTQSKTQNPLASLQEDEFSSLKRPISSGHGMPPLNRSMQPPPSTHQPPLVQPVTSMQHTPPTQHNSSTQQIPSMQHNPSMQQPPSMQLPPSMQQPPSGGVPIHPLVETHSQGFTQQPVFGVAQQAESQGITYPQNPGQHHGPAHVQPLRLNNTQPPVGPHGPSPMGIPAQAQNLHHQPAPVQNQFQVQPLTVNQTQGAARLSYPQNPGQPRPNQLPAVNQSQRPPQAHGMGTSPQQPGSRKSSLTPKQKSALINTGIKVGASLLRTAIKASLTGDSGNDSFDFGGGDVSYDADFTDVGDTSLGNIGLDDTNLGDTNLGDTGFIDTGLGDTGFGDNGLGGDQVFDYGDQSFAQPVDSSFAIAGQDTAQVDVNVDVNIDFGNSAGNGSFETVDDYGGFNNDSQYGPIDGNLGTGSGFEGVFESTQQDSGLDTSSNNTILNGSMLNVADCSIDAEVQINAGSDTTYIGNVGVDQLGGNDVGDMSQGERAIPDYEGTVCDQVVTGTPDYEGTGYGPLTPAGGNYEETTVKQDEKNTQNDGTQAQGDQWTTNNCTDGNSFEQGGWIDPNSILVRRPTTYNPLTSASLSGPLTDFYDGFEPPNTNAPAELNSSAGPGDDEQYSDNPPMFPSLKRPPTQVDDIFPTFSNPPPLPQITEMDAGAAVAPEHDGKTYRPISVTELQDSTSVNKQQSQDFQPDLSGDPSQNSDAIISQSQVHTIPQTKIETMPQNMGLVSGAQHKLPSNTIPSHQATAAPFEPPLNIAPTTMNATK